MVIEKATIKEVKAFARYIHVGPRKVRLLANMIRKGPVDQALEQLKFSSKQAALPLIKVINSAVANAVHNFNLKKEDLVIKSLTVDSGPVSKRFAPRAQGRAFVIRKRTSHINVVLEARPAVGKKRRSIFSAKARVTSPAEENVKKSPEVEKGKVEQSKSSGRQAPKPAQTIKQNIISLKRRLFDRKTNA